MDDQQSERPFVDQLKEYGCVKYATPPQKWVLKSGETSEVYIDLRMVAQHPELLHAMSQRLSSLIDDQFHVSPSPYIIGLPIGGVPFATCIACELKWPMVLMRKEPKKHGTGQMVEIDYEAWAADAPRDVVLVDDVTTTGSTVIDAYKMFESNKIPFRIVAVACVVNRSEKSTIRLSESYSVPVISLLRLDDFVRGFRESVQGCAQRMDCATNAATKKVWETIIAKQSNLCVAADLDNGPDVIRLLDMIGPYICIIKVHFDTIAELDCAELQRVAEKHNVMIMADPKYADTESTVLKKLNQQRFAEKGVSLCTVHGVAGAGPIRALHEHGVGSVVVAQMSNDNLFINDRVIGQWYAAKSANLANICAIVCQTRNDCEAGDGIVYMTPGVHESVRSDGLDQHYRSCHEAIATQRNDIVIVGRGIYESEDPVAAAIMYRDAAYAALVNQKK